MKAFVCMFFATFIAASLAQEKIIEHFNNCKHEIGVSDEALNKLLKDEEVIDPKVKEHNFCWMKKTGFINNNGDLQVETIKSAVIQASDDGDAMWKIIITLVTIQCENDAEKLKQAIVTCKTATGVSDENIVKLRKGERVDDSKLKNYSLCTLKQSGFMNEEGHLQVEVITRKLTAQYGDENEARNVVKKCAVEKETPEVTAYETILCGYRVRTNRIQK